MEVYKSNVVVVTGIGHETDRTLTDYVADVYCHTPTAAAERIIRGYKDVEEKLNSLLYTLKSGTSNIISTKKADLTTSKYLLKSSLPLEDIYKTKNILNIYKNTLTNETNKYLKEATFDLKIMSEKLSTFDYKNQLKKGFALVSDIRGNIIKDKDQLNKKDILRIRFADFEAQAETLDIKEV